MDFSARLEDIHRRLGLLQDDVGFLAHGLGSKERATPRAEVRGEWFQLAGGPGFRLDIVAVILPSRPATMPDTTWSPMVQLRSGQAFDIAEEDYDRLRSVLTSPAHFTEQTSSTQDPPTPETRTTGSDTYGGAFDPVEPAYEAAIQAINRLPRIGVYDYESCAACLRTNYKLVFGDDAPLTDPQDMIQRLAAEIQNLRRANG